MRFRLGLLLGFAIGYVLGARAGRERYAQIVQLWDKVAGSPAAQQFTQEARHRAQQVGETVQAKASEGLSKVGEATKRTDDASTVSPG
ncbi:MAG TPA: YtxH domain-containing protein [Egibacteraceae bacterium]